MDKPAGQAPGTLGDQGANPFTRVPIVIRVTVGHARPTVRDLLSLAPDSVLALDKTVDDPVDLYVGDKLIARGQLEELDGDQAGQLAVRLTEVASGNDAL
ncbi:MAG: FliM/FliN family flagellar motor switch protein [Rhodobacteraceae bacterium]|nr:FliM/FliN family flagellar motor switch protein [Paracoccaceae bacterium]